MEEDFKPCVFLGQSIGREKKKSLFSEFKNYVNFKAAEISKRFFSKYITVLWKMKKLKIVSLTLAFGYYYHDTQLSLPRAKIKISAR